MSKRENTQEENRENTQEMARMFQRAREILDRLKNTYPITGPFVEWKTPLELVIGTMLSAQCTDERVNKVLPQLFAEYPDTESLAGAKVEDVEKIIYSTGFYRAKARYAKGIAQKIRDDFGGRIPREYSALLQLPGVSKKSACIILAKAFNVFVGVPVDTHVLRMAPRLGLSLSKNRDTVARDLEGLYLPKDYLNVNEYLITHGRSVCVPGVPKCGACVLKDLCPSANAFMESQKNRK